jgi:hypothetical protein
VIWLLLRLHRTTLLLAGAVTVLAVLGLAAGRLVATNALIADGLPQSCIAEPTAACREKVGAIAAESYAADTVSILAWIWGPGHLALLTLPLVLGVLAGAGIIGRELGRDTHLLTLTQNVGRTRWWVGRLALAAGVAVVGSVVVSAVGGWAYAPVDGLVGSSQPLVTPSFEASGLVPAGHALLACASAAVLGLLTRSAAVAAFATTVVYGIVLFALATTPIRAGYLPPVVVGVDVSSDAVFIASQPDGQGDWTVDQRYLDAAGDPVPPGSIYGDGRCGTLTECMRDAGVVAVEALVQPASRYWPFQLIETGILLALAAAAVAVGSLRLRRSLVR